MAKNGQKWPKMAFLGGPWVNPHPPPPFCGSNLAWKPRFSPKGPFSRIFGIWGGSKKGRFWVFGQKLTFWGSNLGSKKWSKMAILGISGGSKKGLFGGLFFTFWGFFGGPKNGIFDRFLVNSWIFFGFKFYTKLYFKICFLIIFW